VAHELFEIQTKTRINNSLQVIEFLLDHNPTPQGRDSLIHEQVRLIRELVGLTQYVRPPNGEGRFAIVPVGRTSGL
jgi:hypothetical protein